MKAPYKVFEIDGLSPKDLQAKMNRLSREGYKIIGATTCSHIGKNGWNEDNKVLICEKIGKKMGK